MRYLLDIERPIFLHFLNREAAQAFGSSRDENTDLTALDVLTITHCSKLSVNISQMMEYTFEKPKFQEQIIRLINAGILITSSHDVDIGNFINSRQIMYKSVADRYPMYFLDEPSVENFSIKQTNSFSMTKLLRRDILDIGEGDLALFARRARPEDIKNFQRNIGAFQDIAFRERDHAITRANFAIFAKDKNITEKQLDSAARIFSALYIEHYADQNSTVTSTGLGDVGFIEDDKYFPHYDVPLLREIVIALDWREILANPSGVRLQLLQSYATEEHRIFVSTLGAFLHASYEEVKVKLNRLPGDGGSFETARAILKNHCGHLLRSGRESVRSTPKTLTDFFLISTKIINSAAHIQSLRERVFKKAWEDNMPISHLIRLLFLSATDIEDKSIIRAFDNAGFHREGVVEAGEGYVTRYMSGTHREILHARSSAGSLGASGSELVSADAIKALNPDHVIAAGICFGLQEDKFEIGDILISEEVLDYETVRLSDDEIRERGARIPAGSKLLSAARILRAEYEMLSKRADPGLLISGLKLVNSKKERESLKKRFPDALGGDMEAGGVMAAASRYHRGWIVIKAICDWAFNKGENQQKLAADNAADFSIRMADIIYSAEKADLDDG